MWQRADGVGEAFGLGVAGTPPAPVGQFDTDLVPEADRVDYYRAMLRGLVCAATPTLDATQNPLRVRARNGQLGDALYAHYSATPHRIERSRRDTAAASTGCYFLLRQGGETRSFLQVGEDEHALDAGDCVLGDADEPFLAHETGPLGFSLYLLPKWMVDPALTARGRDRLAKGLATPATTPLGQLLSGWLAGPPDGLAAPTAAGVGAILGRLAAVAAEDGAAGEPEREAVRAARARLALGEIDRGFADPLFGPADVAETLGVSVRSLHLALEDTGFSFTEHLTRRRLLEARTRITSGRSRTILDAALDSGFNDLSTFYRSFRRVFGAAPRELIPPPPG